MLSPRWRKIIRDIRNSKTRTMLVVLSIAVGVFAFASVFITRDVLIAEMDAQTRANNPTNIRFNVSSDDDSLVTWARRQPEVADAQVRARHYLKLVTPEQTYNILLHVYGDYENLTMNRLFPEEGNWPPERRQIWLERTSFAQLGDAIGERVTIELRDGSRYQLEVAGSVHDVDTVPYHLSIDLTGFVTMETLRWMGLPDEYNRLEVVTAPGYATPADLEVAAQNIRERLQRVNITVGSSTIASEPGEHWAKDVTDSFILILSFVGLLSLALSAFLVVNTMSALMLEQQRQIGMMKAIGGGSRQIIGLYLTLVIIYGLLALAVAVPVGLGLAYAFTWAVAQFINLDIASFHMPVSVLLLQVIAALVLPVIAAAIPILSGIKVPVQEAISIRGIKRRDGHGRLDRLVLRAGGLPRPVLLALRNTFRSKGRLLLTLSTLTLAGALFIGVVNMRGSLSVEMDNIMGTFFNYEVNVNLNGRYSVQGIENRLASVPGIVETGGNTETSGRLVAPDGTEGDTFPIIGTSPEDDFVKAQIISGRWFNAADRNGLVLSTDLLEDMPGVKVGDELTVKIGEKEYEWKVTGIMLMAFERIAYTNFDYLSGLTGSPGMASSAYIRTWPKDPSSQERIARAAEQRLKDSGVEVSNSVTKESIVSSIAGQFDFLIGFLLSMAAMSATIGGLGLAGMMGISVMERTREIGVIRSIGASNLAVGGIVITEGLLIGVISWLLALPFSLPISLVFNVLMGDVIIDQTLVFVFNPVGPLIWLAIVAVISVVASLLPAYRAIKMSVRETIAYE